MLPRRNHDHVVQARTSASLSSNHSHADSVKVKACQPMCICLQCNVLHYLQQQKGKQAIASKLGVKKNSGVVKKGKAAAGTATTLAGKASEAAQRVATAAQGAAATAATTAQDAATAVKDAAAHALLSAKKVSWICRSIAWHHCFVCRPALRCIHCTLQPCT